MLALVVVCAFSALPAVAFEPSTHEELSERAAKLSSLGTGDLLKTTFPEFWLGLDQKLEGLEVFEHIRAGSDHEDDFPRPVNHFHDPTRAWDSAGFSLLFGGLQIGDSSIRWQQSAADDFQWPKARESYLAALLEKDPAERERLFAQTFRSLGHIIHLVQDVATPAHSRNDNHFFVDRFHVWAADHKGDIPTIGSVPFTGDLATATSDSLAPRPVARIIDATEADRGGPAFTPDIGLAEYSNSQFLSDDRRFGTYAYPRFAAMVPVDASRNGTVPGARRHYLQFSAASGEGETDYFVAAQLPLYDKSAPNRRRYLTSLDDRVLRDYGDKLLPRAVGYSMTAIDHFFRGKIAISAPDRFAYGRALYEKGNTSTFQTLRFKVANASPPGQETSADGDLWAVVHYRTSSSNLFDDPGAPLSADPSYAVAGPKTISLSRTPQEVRLDFPAGEGLPANAADVWLIVVYQGTLGGEDDAVLVGGMDLAEPEPIDFANLTDYDCFDEQPYYVGNLPPDDPARDVDGDGSKDLVGPHAVIERHRKVWPAESFVIPSSGFFDYFVPESRVVGGATVAEGITPTSRHVTIVDADWIQKIEQRGEMRDENGTLIEAGGVTAYGGFPANWNYLEHDALDPLLGPIRRYRNVGTYRGVTGFTLAVSVTRNMNYYVTYCIDQLRNAPPDLTRIPGELAPEEPP